MPLLKWSGVFAYRLRKIDSMLLPNRINMVQIHLHIKVLNYGIVWKIMSKHFNLTALRENFLVGYQTIVNAGFIVMNKLP